MSLDKKYPVPKRGPPKPSPPNVMREIELGQRPATLADGRPALIETWFCCESRCLLLTAFYSVVGAEFFTDADHLALLTRSQVINDHRAKPLNSIGLKRLNDDANQPMFSVTIVLVADFF